MADWGLTEAGFVAPRAADFLETMKAAFVAALAEEEVSIDVDIERDTVLGNLFAVEAQAFGDLSEALQMAVDQFDPNNAQGLQLENLSALVGITKNPATYGTVTIELTGDVGTFLSKGTYQVRGGGTDGRAVWENAEDITMADTTQEELFQCTEKGSIQALADTITEIVTPVEGISAVTNPEAATPGNDEETDAALRLRRQQSLQISGGGSTAAIQANLLEIDGVTGALVLANDEPTAQVVQGITVNPCSIAAILYPDTMTDAVKQEVAETIYLLSYNTNTTGTDVVATVVGADGQDKTIRFDFATEVTVDVGVVLTMKDGYETTDVDDEIEEVIADYFGTLNLGDDVRLLKLYASIADIEGIEDATISIEGLEDSYAITAAQIAVVGTISISEAP